MVPLILGTMAFPAVWYGFIALGIWADFRAALAATSDAQQIYVWRGHGLALGDNLFVAFALWLIHLTVVLIRRSAWRSLPPELWAICSGLAGGLTYVIGRLLVAIAAPIPAAILVGTGIGAVVISWLLPQMSVWLEPRTG